MWAWEVGALEGMLGGYHTLRDFFPHPAPRMLGRGQRSRRYFPRLGPADAPVLRACFDKLGAVPRSQPLVITPAPYGPCPLHDSGCCRCA